MPAKAGIQKYLKTLDSRLRGNDTKGRFKTIYESINTEKYISIRKIIVGLKLTQEKSLYKKDRIPQIFILHSSIFNLYTGCRPAKPRPSVSSKPHMMFMAWTA
jgi:hypothetical protein